jgi:hypothetical protein
MRLLSLIWLGCLGGCLGHLFGPPSYASGTASVGIEPGAPVAAAAERYTISQVVMVAGAVVMLSMDNNPTPSTAELQEIFTSVFEAYSAAVHVPQADVEGAIKRYSPVVYLSESIDCGRAHNGVGECGGFIAGDNSIHINMSGWQKCLARTSLQHFLVHYLEGVLVGDQDGGHVKLMPWQAEQEARRRIVIAQQQCQGAPLIAPPAN